MDNESNILEFKVDDCFIVVDFNTMEWTSTWGEEEEVTWSLRVRDGMWESSRDKEDWSSIDVEYQDMFMNHIGTQFTRSGATG